MTTTTDDDQRIAESDARYESKAAFARRLKVRPCMVSKYVRQRRILIAPNGLVDVAASLAMLRSSLDPSRGGKGGKSNSRVWATTLQPPPMPEHDDLDDDDDEAELQAPPPGCSRHEFPAGDEFQKIADWLRGAVLVRFADALSVYEARGRAAGTAEFRDWLEAETAGLARMIHLRVVELEKFPHRAKPLN